MLKLLIKPKEVLMFQFLKVIPRTLIQRSFYCFVSALTLMALSPNARAQLFTPKVDYTVGLRPYHLVSADFDGDGDFDLVTAAWGTFLSDGIDSVCVLMNNGDGTFASPVKYNVGDALSLAAVDLDNDGNVDLAATDSWLNKIYILLNGGGGAFVVADSFPSVGLVPHKLCAPDLDGDGDFDLAVPNFGSNNLSVFFNNGDATFTGPVTYATGVNPHTVISADLDTDGDSDLVVTNNGSASVSVLKNNGAGAFAPRVNYPVRIFPQTPSLADYNGDGCLDLAVPNTSPSTPFVSVLMGNCDGTFDPKVDYPGCRPHTVASADYDIDGDIDMAVTNNECNSVSIFLNNGDGTFAPHFTLPAGTGTQHIVAKDFNADGDLDLAATNFDNDGAPGDNISIFMNLTTLVVGQPKIGVLPDTLDFGDAVVSYPETLKVIVRNLGFPDTLDVSNISSDNSDFSPGVATLQVPGASAQSMNVVFNPSTAGVISANLTFTSNDPANSTFPVVMRGTVCAAVKGDMNASGDLTPADVVLMLNCVFLGSGDCTLCFADANCSGDLTPADVVLELNGVFLGSPFSC